MPKTFVPEKNLEKKTKEMLNKKCIMERLFKSKPNRNAVFTAIEELEKEEEIKQFYQEYIEYLKEEGDTKEVRENAEGVANRNIGYILGYYDQKTSDKWNTILEKVYHPIFGKNIPFQEKPEKVSPGGRNYEKNQDEYV